MGQEATDRLPVIVRDQDLLRTLMDSLPDAIYFKDRESRFVRINRALAAMIGVADPAEAVGKTDFDFYERPYAQRAFEAEQEILRSGQPLVDSEEKMVGRDGKERWFSATKLPLRDPDGAVIGTFGLSRDITQHKRNEELLRHSESLYHSLVESLPQCIFRKDLDGKLTFANQRFCQTVGKTIGDLIGKGDFDLFPPDLAAKYRKDDQWVVKTGQVFEAVEEHQGPDGNRMYVHVVKAPIVDFRGYIIGIEGIFWDETELTRARKALEESRERYKLALEGSHDGIWDWNLLTQEIYYSRRWREMLGAGETVPPHPDEWFKRVHPDDVEALRSSISAHLGGRSAHLECEFRILHKQKAYRWVLARGLAVRDEHGRAVRMAGSLTDITDRKRAEEELAHQAFYDSLTDLPNRSLFLDRLNHAIRRAKRRQALFAILFLDVDRFKDVNDSLGHATGDKLLRAIAERLEQSVRPGDTVARLGGDEFTVLLEDMKTPDDAVDVAQRILHELKRPFQLEGQEVFAGASIGIAPGTPEMEAEDLLRDADTAMYRAKDRGRGTYEVFDSNMHQRAVLRLQLETDLRKAIEREEFQVYYQPIVSLSKGAIVGFEALARWKHPQRGIVSPGEFIPLAEETGLVVPLDLWVLKAACAQTRKWQERWPELTINVNLSTRQFGQPGLVDKVASALKEAGYDPARLKLEITESVILEDVPAISAILFQLKAMDIQLYLDDFGTGYSSLGYLHRFPIDSLKIHHSFVGQLGRKGEDAELVRTITTLAGNLKMGVVAEGVETADQLRRLREFQCDRVQGFLFSKPVPAPAAEALLAAPLKQAL